MKQHVSCDITHAQEKIRGSWVLIQLGIEGLRRAAQNAEEASASEAQAPTKARQHITSAGKQIFTYGT